MRRWSGTLAKWLGAVMVVASLFASSTERAEAQALDFTRNATIGNNAPAVAVGVMGLYLQLPNGNFSAAQGDASGHLIVSSSSSSNVVITGPVDGSGNVLTNASVSNFPTGTAGNPNASVLSIQPCIGCAYESVTGTSLVLTGSNSVVIANPGVGLYGFQFTSVTGSTAVLTISKSSDGGTTYSTAAQIWNPSTSTTITTGQISADGRYALPVADADHVKIAVTTTGTGTATISRYGTFGTSPLVTLLGSLPTGTNTIGTVNVGQNSSGVALASLCNDATGADDFQATISSATTTLLVSAVTSKRIHVCTYHVRSQGVQTWSFEYGTGSLCATGCTALTPVTSEAANTGELAGNGVGDVLQPTGIGTSLWLVTTTSATITVWGTAVAY